MAERNYHLMMELRINQLRNVVRGLGWEVVATSRPPEGPVEVTLRYLGNEGLQSANTPQPPSR